MSIVTSCVIFVLMLYGGAALAAAFISGVAGSVSNAESAPPPSAVNLCELPGGHAIVVDSSDDVTIRRNRIVDAKEPIYVQHSTHVKVYDNFGAVLTAGAGCQVASPQDEHAE